MTAAGLLVDLVARGVRFEVVEGRLRVDAPSGVLGDSDREALVRHKPALLDLLAPRQRPAPAFVWDQAEAECLLAEVREALARVDEAVAAGKAPTARGAAMRTWLEVAEGCVNGREMEAARGWDALDLLRGAVARALILATPPAAEMSLCVCASLGQDV